MKIRFSWFFENFRAGKGVPYIANFGRFDQSHAKRGVLSERKRTYHGPFSAPYTPPRA